MFSTSDLFEDGPSADSDLKNWLTPKLEQSAVPTIWVTAKSNVVDSTFAGRLDMALELSTPPVTRRREILLHRAGHLLTPDSLDRLASISVLSPNVVSRAVRVLGVKAEEWEQTERESAMLSLVGRALEAQGRGSLSKLNAGAMVDGYDPDLVTIDRAPEELLAGLERARSARVCFYGPPGTGKTGLGRWLARRMGMPLIVKQASELLSRYSGDTEKNIAKSFLQAKNDRAVLMIDEIDSFLSDRTKVRASWEVIQINEFLTQMEQFEGIFFATTNLMEGIDPAALRRFDLKLRFSNMRPGQIERMFKQQCALLEVPFCAQAQERASRISNLTPGDFGAIQRQHRFSPLGSASDFCEALEAESAIKLPTSKPIGFV